MATKRKAKAEVATSEFALEDDVEVPAGRGKYPWAQMSVGQSFTLPAERAASAMSSAKKWGADNEASFTQRKIDEDTVRIWRTA